MLSCWNNSAEIKYKYNNPNKIYNVDIFISAEFIILKNHLGMHLLSESVNCLAN